MGELTGEQAERFVAARRAAGRVTWVSPQSVMLPLAYLRELGVAPTTVPAVVEGPLEELLADYCRYLLVERGLSQHTVLDAYGPAARLFLAEREGPDGLELERLSAADVSSFLARECPKRSVSGARDLVCALRSLLRYLHLAGLIEAPLVWAVPSVADLRDRTLPRGLEPAAVKKLLASCDRRTLVGRRDYAILLLLARLGLRAGEVAAIQLEDVDWRAGLLLVRGKGGRQDVLPLPVDVGEAIVSYLRRRPRCECRALFLRVTAPRRELNRSTIGWIVRAACDRAGLAESWRASPAAHGRDRDAQAGRVAGRDRPGAAPPRAEDDRDIRQGRPQGAPGARAPVAVAGRCGMTTLREALADYLRIRRRLGFEMPQDGRLLEGFVEFLERAGAERITTELALMWARTPVHAHPHRWRQRLSVVRGFARHLATIDPASEVPSKDLLPGHRPRIAPYIYTDAEITALMAAAGTLRPPLRAARHQTLIGLLGGHRDAPRRGARARPPGRRSPPRRGARPCGQAEEAARGAAAPEHDPRAARVRPPARRTLPRALHRRRSSSPPGDDGWPEGSSTGRSRS